MPQATRLRAQMVGPQEAMVKILMQHPMESGQRRTPDGAAVPAWFIEHVEVRCQGEAVLQADWGPSVASNPFLQFRLLAVQAGDLIEVFWRDNQGQQRLDSGRVLAALA